MQTNDTKNADKLVVSNSRRKLLGLGSSARLAVAGVAGATLASRALANGGGTGAQPAFLVQLFLRGGADGLSLLCPYADPHYQTYRSETRILDPTPPLPAGTDIGHYAIPLGGSQITNAPGAFGIPRALQPLKQVYNEGRLAFIHATGNVDGIQSHFAAQDSTEKGANHDVNLPADGWLARHLATKTDHLSGDPRFRAMTYRSIQSVSLFGSRVATPISDPLTYAFPDPLLVGSGRRNRLFSLYDSFGTPLDDAFDATDEAISTITGVDFEIDPPAAVDYPDTDFGTQMKRVAQIPKQTDVEVVNISIDGWDKHTNQGVFSSSPEGGGARMYDLMDDLARGMRAFYEEMRGEREYVVLALSEFGRKVPENGNAGTDHGKGGVALVMGTNVNGGKLYGDWPGLAPADLDELDLAVTTDIRRVLHEVADRALRNPGAADLFRVDLAGAPIDPDYDTPAHPQPPFFGFL